ncbi:PH domain-containing protein, partial [Vibrio anguillarum]
EFLEQQLQPDEKVKYSAKISTKPLLADLALLIFALLIFLITGYWLIFMTVGLVLYVIVHVIYFYIYSKTSEFVITDQRVLGKVGFFSRHTFEIRLSQGEGLAVNQSVFGRLFNFGAITSSGTGASKVSMLYLDSPFEVRKQILSNTK